MDKLLFKLAAIPAHCRFGNFRARLLGDVGMKKPDWIYTATIFAVALFTVCILIWGPQ